MFDFGVKDVIDILIVATILFYVYKIMKESGTLSEGVGHAEHIFRGAGVYCRVVCHVGFPADGTYRQDFGQIHEHRIADSGDNFPRPDKAFSCGNRLSQALAFHPSYLQAQESGWGNGAEDVGVADCLRLHKHVEIEDRGVDCDKAERAARHV